MELFNRRGPKAGDALSEQCGRTMRPLAGERRHVQTGQRRRQSRHRRGAQSACPPRLPRADEARRITQQKQDAT